MRYIFLFCLIFISGSVFSQWKYPETKNVDIQDTYWGVTYSDPIEKIKNVKIDQLKKTVDIDTSFSLSSSSEPLEDFSFLGIAAVGYAKVVGPYYEGFNSATTIRLGAFYLIDAPWFIGFNYGYSSFTGDQIPRLVYNTFMDRKCNNLSFNEYCLEVGGIFSLFSGNLHIYGLLGLTWVSQTQNLSFTADDLSPIKDHVKDYGEIDTIDLLGYKIEAGVIIPVVNKINTVISFSFQVHNVQKDPSTLIAIYSDGSSSAINDENNGILNFTVGIMYPF